jgi:hypothetical protein
VIRTRNNAAEVNLKRHPEFFSTAGVPRPLQPQLLHRSVRREGRSQDCRHRNRAVAQVAGNEPILGALLLVSMLRSLFSAKIFAFFLKTHVTIQFLQKFAGKILAPF